MKNTVKRLASVLLVIIICFSLCSCSMLDEMKEQQAFFLNDDKTEFVWKGVNYKQIPVNDDIFYNNLQPGGYITESDVPVLLSELYGYYFWVCEPMGLIETGGNFYCKTDEYDYYMTLIATYNKDKYAYRTEEIIGPNAYRANLNIVDEETIKAIEYTLAFCKVKNFNLQTQWMYTIYTCEDTGTFYDRCFDVVEVRGEGYYFQYEDKINGEEYYKVPDEYKKLFDKIYDDVQTQDKYW
ncbi:MAG: hypothetical protein IKV36_02820 [Clostridia bacterium]|nr:hypothetical protein [Clostridia bacterium]